MLQYGGTRRAPKRHTGLDLAISPIVARRQIIFESRWSSPKSGSTPVCFDTGISVNWIQHLADHGRSAPAFAAEESCASCGRKVAFSGDFAHRRVFGPAGGGLSKASRRHGAILSRGHRRLEFQRPSIRPAAFTQHRLDAFPLALRRQAAHQPHHTTVPCGMTAFLGMMTMPSRT